MFAELNLHGRMTQLFKSTQSSTRDSKRETPPAVFAQRCQISIRDGSWVSLTETEMLELYPSGPSLLPLALLSLPYDKLDSFPSIPTTSLVCCASENAVEEETLAL